MKFLRFALGAKLTNTGFFLSWPFIALSPRTFTKCVDAALAPLWLQGIRILNNIDDWLILAQSEQTVVRHRDVVLTHMKELGLRLERQESVLSPLQRTTYLGVVWGSTAMQARLSPARVELIPMAVARISHSLSSFRNCWVWWQLRPMGYLLACCSWDLNSGGSRPRGFPEGQPTSHD